jgi:nucleoside-diphosphate-sugar epimerase
MKVLVLGGTAFVGRALVAQALAHGAEVTVFNRGSQPPPSPVRVLRGDRTTGDLGALGALDAGEWDFVLDTWKGAPFAVHDTARLLRERATTYALVSTRSVYTWPPAPGLTETGPVVEGDPEAGREGPAPAYAEAKRGAELAVTESFGDRALLLRAGLILGPYENIGRLPWWLLRIARGGDVPAPGPRDLGLQYVDARDLAAFALWAGEQRLGGAYDVISEPGFTTMGELLDTCVDLTGSRARLRWVSPEAVEAAGVKPWTELPVWLPPGPAHGGMHGSDPAKALAAGLTLRPVGETVADTWAWLSSLPEPPAPTSSLVLGLSADAEARLLAAQAARE